MSPLKLALGGLILSGGLRSIRQQLISHGHARIDRLAN